MADNKLARDATLSNIVTADNGIKTALENLLKQLVTNEGSLSSLKTSDKNNLISAINEVFTSSQTNATNINALKDIYAIVDEVSTPETGEGLHNSIYRGKKLGSELTTEQITSINNGTFKGIYMGDYWERSITYTIYKNLSLDEAVSTTANNKFTICGCDYYYRAGDTAMNTHHVVTYSCLMGLSSKMHTSNDTSGGYVNSGMRTVTLKGAINAANAFFGEEHVLNYRDFLINSVHEDGWPNGGSWYNCRCELFNEPQIMGGYVLDSGSNTGSPRHRHSVSNHIMPLFAIRRMEFHPYFWLRNPVSKTAFAVYCEPCRGTINSRPAASGEAYNLAILYTALVH